ncbi:hypothetical protein CCAX7_003170 [Capsulimonas corticalis]|uniref:Uncharacterized protein n=1 Tax=Capsulimonas corticalis TaxID=2219043 RepID=A0A402CS70_9BACT|nr:hypothetical protein CCAX7_003170 [Capsulimonas corticalis]
MDHIKGALKSINIFCESCLAYDTPMNAIITAAERSVTKLAILAFRCSALFAKIDAAVDPPPRITPRIDESAIRLSSAKASLRQSLLGNGGRGELKGARMPVRNIIVIAPESAPSIIFRSIVFL